MEVRGADGDVPRVDELDPYRLKATPSQFGDSGRYGVADPYLPRTHADVDRRVAAALAGNRLVLVIGPSKAGKTRTLFEAVRHTLPGARVVVPDPASLAEISVCEQYRTRPEAMVVWLENLDEFTRAEPVLTPRLLAALTARAARTVVVATLRSEKYEELRAGGELARDVRAVFEQADRIELAPTSADADEQAAAKTLYPSLDLTRYGLAEMLAGAPALLAHYLRGRVPGRITAQSAAYTAVVEVVIDWARIGRSDPLCEDRLIEYARTVIDTRYSAYDITDADLTTAITQARQPQQGTGHTTAIDPTWLTDPRTRGYRPFDYLTAADDGQHDNTPRPVPEPFWHTATLHADNDTLISVGVHAYRRGHPDIALALTHRPADSGDTDAMYNLGLLLKDRGDLAAAETWWRQAADSGHAGAMSNLGVLLEGRGDLTAAETWYRQAADSGHAVAMSNLGAVLKDRGDLTAAETWYRQAADTGHAGAMYNLGVLLKDQGDLAAAETWWRQAADTGDTDAMYNLGVLFKQRGDHAAAEIWWRQAADTGHTVAMYKLGVLFKQRGDHAAAETWYRQAADSGHTVAMNNLGLLLKDRGDLAAAETWWRQAADAGDSDAMGGLGVLFEQRGDHAAAETWYRQAADSGHAGAMFALVILLRKREETS
ncbi:tetratricopeptide repeat protein [Nocardia vinacea]|uniref:Tetratricopeptide repeat protein n=1 Tax=Nocardia vinacea TaxID=96468 RepID=A0ABZ1Z6H8_9NOCA|nr:SEL1-like repeat protein [Nocardia vinacea]